MMEAVSQWFRCCLSIKFFIHLVVSCGSWPTAISIARRSDDHARTRHQTPPLIKSHLSHTSEGPFTLGAPTTSWSEWPKICLAVVVALLYVENSMDQLFLIHKKESFGTVPTSEHLCCFLPKSQYACQLVSWSLLNSETHTINFSSLFSFIVWLNLVGLFASFLLVVRRYVAAVKV